MCFSPLLFIYVDIWGCFHQMSDKQQIYFGVALLMFLMQFQTKFQNKIEFYIKREKLFDLHYILSME